MDRLLELACFFFIIYTRKRRDRGGRVVKELCYRLEGRVVLAWGSAVVEWLMCCATDCKVVLYWLGGPRWYSG